MSLPLKKLRPGQAREVSGASSTSERLFQILGDVAPGFLWIVGSNGRFLYTNRAWEEYTGSDLDQLNAVGWEGFNHPDELGAVRLKWTEAIEQGRPFEMELRYRRHDG
jgi:PAS domain S-box-containing protein